jgi:RimJ/RimL family protein N-acetyltransferase
VPSTRPGAAGSSSRKATFVGLTAFTASGKIDRKAHFVIGMFSASHIGRGLGTDATRLILAHGFGSMRLDRVDFRVLAFNHGAIASYINDGFVQEGRERQSCWLDGHWHDDIIMGVPATEFPGPD